MSPVADLLKAIGERLIDFGGRMAVDRIVLGEVLGHVVKSLLEERPVEQTRAEILALLDYPSNELPTLIDEIAREVGGNRPEKVHAVGAFLDQIQVQFRKMILPGHNPKQSIEQTVQMHQPEALARFFPVRVPRFRINDRPESMAGWVLVRMLGQGGFGEVWLARHPDFHATQAAFKFCLGTDMQNRLLKHEAKVLNQVMQEQHHSGIVKLLDAKLDSNPPWLKYEYVPGGELGTLVREWSHLPFTTRLDYVNRVIAELAEVVGYFHALTPSVIHRDLKPSNILVERDRKHADHWHLRVADFGIGNFSVKTALDRERMITSLSLAAQVQRAHTPLYASPQQRAWKDPDPRDDVYSLGMIWYQLLCDDLFAPVPTDDPIAAIKVGYWFKPFLDLGAKREYLELIDACLAKDADKRPANGNQLLDRLSRLEAIKTTVVNTKPQPIVSQPFPSNLGSGSESSVINSDSFPLSSQSDPNGFELPLTDLPTDTRNQSKDNLGSYDPQWKDIFQDIGEYEEAKLTSNEAVNAFLRVKTPTRLKRWKEAGKVNLPEALHLIAECYDRGIGFNQNKEKAATIFRVAERKGYVPPPSLGDEWDDEIPEGINPTLRSDFENARLGDRVAQFNVGWAYMEGEGVPQDDGKAIEWYRKSADQGYMLAEYNMGWMYDRGRGVPKDEKKAVEWYIKAANQGYTDAAYNLGIIFANGRGVPKDEKKAVEWYIKAAEKGHESAQFNLGIHYSNGRGVPQDDGKAIEWYEKAAFQGAADAQYNLALLYANAKGSLRNDKKAVEWYTRAATQGYMAAQHNLALMYEDGLGVNRDPAKAVEWYEKAAFQGYARSQYNLGLMYANGSGVPKDEKKAVEWYRYAAEQGFASAQHNLGLMYEDGRGIEKDPSTAVLWYRKAAEQGFINAQYALGLMYEDGRGVMKDEKKAVEWYRKAAEQGYAPAECGLGVMHEYGRGVMKDEKQAVEWYRKAALKGLAEALYNLGRMYDYGKGVAQDDKQALEWYQKAVDRGYQNATKNIGIIQKRQKK